MATDTINASAVPAVLKLEGLRVYRQIAGLTQTALAERVGLTKHTISDLERGATSPRLSTARRLAAVLKAPSIEALFPETAIRPTIRRARAKRRKSGE